MNMDELATKFPRSARLLSACDVRSSESPEDSGLADGNVHLVPSAQGPAILINLVELEGALTGFRDTGTWGDYFPPADDSSEGPELTLPKPRAGIANYRIDKGKDEDQE